MNAAKKLWLEQQARVDIQVFETAGDKCIEDIVTDRRSGYVQSELAAYLAFYSKYPVLRDQEDYTYLFNAYSNGSETERLRARDLITYGNVKLVVRVALWHTNRGLPLLDLIQEGMVGVFHSAIPNYKIELGYRFSTYAHQWIRQAMSRAIQDMSEKRAYRIPVHFQDLVSKVRRACGELYLASGKWPRELQIYEHLRQREEERRRERAEQGKPVDDKAKMIGLADVVRALAMIHSGTPVRLDAPVRYNGSDEDDDCLIDIFNPGPPKTDTVVEARRLCVEYGKALQRIESAVDQLAPRLATIVRLRLGLGDFEPMTLQEVGDRYEVTRERIRQLEDKAMVELEGKLGITRLEIEEIIDVTQDLEVVAHAI